MFSISSRILSTGYLARMANQQTPVVFPPSPHPLLGGSGAVAQYRTLADTTLTGSYASFDDFALISLPENTQYDYSRESIERWLRVASRQADSYVGQRFRTPLQLYSEAWVWLVCELAYFGVATRRGYNPDGHAGEDARGRREMALAWLQAARDYEVTPDQRLATTEPFHVAEMYSLPQRGWQR